jgi:hypothetical protein
MNHDRIEELLRRQPVRLPPAEWRNAILRTARAEQSAPPARVSTPWWRQWLWPSPVAWASVAAVWVLALILHLSTPQPQRTAPAYATASPPSVPMTFAEQRAWLDLVLQPASAQPSALRLVPGPRSDRIPSPVNA